MSRLRDKLGSNHIPFREVRAAKTVSVEAPYPSEPSTVYEVELGSVSFPKTPGNQNKTFTAYSPRQVRYAKALPYADYFPQGTEVFVMLINGQYFILDIATSDGGSSGIGSTIIEFTLNEDMGATTTGQASATCNAIYGNQDPATVGASFIAKDVLGEYNRALSGCGGFAYYDTNASQWIVIQVQQTADRIRVKIAQSDDGGSESWGASPEHSTISITNVYHALSPGPHNFLPPSMETQTYANEYKLYAPVGAYGILEYDQTLDRYYLASVEHEEPHVVFGTVNSDRSIASPGNTLEITPTAAIGGPKPDSPLTVRDATLGSGAITGNALGVVSGDWIVAAYDRDNDEWRVVQSANHSMGFIATADAKIGAATQSSGSPGSGTVTLKVLSGGSYVDLVINSTTQKVTAYHMSEIAVASGAWLRVAPNGRGTWEITTEYCKKP